MAPKTIMALAVGNPEDSKLIETADNLHSVRPYIRGLIDGLAGLGPQLGIDLLSTINRIGLTISWMDSRSRTYRVILPLSMPCRRR
jgi:hypothetical protein